MGGITITTSLLFVLLAIIYRYIQTNKDYTIYSYIETRLDALDADNSYYTSFDEIWEFFDLQSINELEDIYTLLNRLNLSVYDFQSYLNQHSINTTDTNLILIFKKELSEYIKTKYKNL